MVNFVEDCVNLLEMSLDFYSKEKALFGASPMSKLELEFIDDTITAIQGDKNGEDSVVDKDDLREYCRKMLMREMGEI